MKQNSKDKSYQNQSSENDRDSIDKLKSQENNIFEPATKEYGTKIEKRCDAKTNESKEYLGTFQIFMNQNFEFEFPSQCAIPRTRKTNRGRKRSSSTKHRSLSRKRNK